jgi:Flp pilus assembly protein TadG
MFAMLLATGMAVDIGHLYNAKTELQNAADAASIAAASQLNSTSGGIQCAVIEATKALNKYDFKNSVSIPSSSVTFAVNLNGTYMSDAAAMASPTTIRFVKVTIPPQPVTVTFASLVISRTQNISATATAGLSVGLTMNKFYTAFTFIESAAAPLVKGQTYSLAPKAYNDSTAGSYRVLEMPSGPGSDLVTTGPIHAYGYANIGYKVALLAATSPPATPTSPSMCRSAKIGTNTRFADYTVHPNVNPTAEPPDTIIQEGITYQQYTDMQGSGVVQRADGARNRRVMTLPIALNTQYNTTTRTVTANRIGAFFIRSKVGSTCGLDLEYIGDRIAVPVGTYQPGGIQFGDLSIPVLYK